MKKSLALMLVLLSHTVTAANLSEQEQNKSRIVKGIYQLTDGALVLCPEKNAQAFSNTLMLFKQSFPDVMRLVDNSPYKPVGKKISGDNVETNKNIATPALTQQCLFKQRMLNNMMVTEEGKQTMVKALETLNSAS